MRSRLKIGTVSKLVKMLSPDFVEIEGFILLPTEVGYYKKNLKGFSDKSSFEAFQNHTHMIDLFKHSASQESSNEEDGDFYDQSHPDFQDLCYVGKFMAKTWLEKLKEQFPNYRFRVYYTAEDNPVVRFHRVRPNEPVWLDESKFPKEISAGKIVVYDTGNR